MARGPQFPRRKKWGEVIDHVEAEVARLSAMNAKGALSGVEPYRDALLAMRATLKRRRADYFTAEDKAAVNACAWPLSV